MTYPISMTIEESGWREKVSGTRDRMRFHTGKGKDRRSMEDREIHTEKITTTITDRGMLIVMRGKGRRKQETRHGNFVEICT